MTTCSNDHPEFSFERLLQYAVNFHLAGLTAGISVIQHGTGNALIRSNLNGEGKVVLERTVSTTGEQVAC